MYKIPSFFIVYLLSFFYGSGQTNSTIKAELNDEDKLLIIEQSIEYFNSSKDTLTEIHFLDWANAFKDKTTPLAIRFTEDYRRAFHFSLPEERGNTEIHTVNSDTKPLGWIRPIDKPDAIVVPLNIPLAPEQSIKLDFKYNVKVAEGKFTDYGYFKKDYKLRYWHLAPAVYTNKWESYSHKNLNDFTADYSNYSLILKTKHKEHIESNLVIDSISNNSTNYAYYLSGKHISNINLFIDEHKKFYSTTVENTQIITDIPFDGISITEANKFSEKVFKFVTEYYGIPPQEKIVLDYTDYKKQPVYGFNQFPKFLRPFEKEFQYEIITLKQMTKAFGRLNFKTNLRSQQWITDALQVYVMMKYMESYYPETKLAGRLNKVFGIRWFNAAKIPFNDQYYLGYKNMPARFLQQKLSVPKDSLLKFNYNISNPYKAGMGLNYFESHSENPEMVKETIHKLTTDNQLDYIDNKKFFNSLKQISNKDISWFTNNFIDNNEVIDFKIKKIKRSKDSVAVTIKNKGKNIPVKLTGLKNKKVVSNQWLPNIKDTLTIKYSRSQFDQFVIDYDELLPELNRRNNYYRTKGLLNKKLKLRFFQDVENPEYYEIFTIPQWEFNVYDGFVLGGTFYNRSLIRKNLLISVSPFYGTNSQKLIGSAGVSYTHQLKESGWYLLSAGLSGNTQSFAEDLQFTSYSPNVVLSYRGKDLRKNLGQSVSLRYASIHREESETIELPTPNYNIAIAKYNYAESYLDKIIAFGFEFQQAKNFNKIIGTFNYRKLFLNNQQVNFRLYAGSFINNKTFTQNQDYFSFGLFRPTDYLFEYDYLSRDDNSGLASQQLITAEGNFKSRVDTRFANQWIASASLESTIWNWIYAYGDGAVIKNKYIDPVWQYDSGIKFNLVQDYFELYFPLQSSLGFEPSLPNYHERIRFKITLSLNTLTRLFTREWY